LVGVIEGDDAVSLVVLGERIAKVEVRARGRVANHESLEVTLRKTIGVHLARIQNHLRQLRQVVTGIGLTSQHELVRGVLGELLEPALQNVVVIVRRDRIVERGVTRHVGETNLSGTFNIQHVRNCVPSVGVVHEVAGTVRVEGTILAQQASQGRASRASIEPRNERVSSRVVLRLKEPL